MIWKPVRLVLSDEEIERLKTDNARLQQHLEANFPLQSEILDSLIEMLTYLVNNIPDLRREIDTVLDSEENHSIILIHPDSEILSLPWSAAIDQRSGKKLGDIQNLFINKLLPVHSSERHEPPALKAPAPLKVLVVISCPLDTKTDIQRIFQQQEFLLLEAFHSLVQSKEVEVYFAPGSSLKAIREAIKQHQFHLLYFAGQGILQGGEGHVILEDTETRNTEIVHGSAFADALRSNPEYQIPAIFLSLCQMTDKGTETALRDISRELIKGGTSAVVALGGAVKLRYAVAFARHFIMRSAQKWPFFIAFNASTKHIYQLEQEDLEQAGRENPNPLQWILPNLYSSGKIGTLGDWSIAPSRLIYNSFRFPAELSRAIKQRSADHLFIGRRENLVAVRPHFSKKAPVLLKGPSGIGKTALAQQLVSRIIEDEENIIPFVFGEKIRAVHELLDTMQNFLLANGDMDVIVKIKSFETAKEIFTYLLYEIAKHWQPVFVFDNLEEFQSAPGENFDDRYQGLADIIHFLCHIQRFHVILTNRYAMPDFPEVQVFEIDSPGLADFWKRCYYLNITDLAIYLCQPEQAALCNRLFHHQPIAFGDLVKMIYKNIGGNYQALALFAVLVEENIDLAAKVLIWLEKVYEASELENGRIPARAGIGFILPHMINLLDTRQQLILRILSRFRIPVQISAVLAQIPGSEDADALETITGEMLDRLFELNLIEINIDQKTHDAYYYVTPPIRTSLEKIDRDNATDSFDHLAAGRYHHDCYNKLGGSLTELKEAFYHFTLTSDANSVLKTGEILSDFYYALSMMNVSFYFAWQIHKSLNQKTPISIWYRIAEILGIFGKYDDAITIYKNMLTNFQAGKDYIKLCKTLGYLGDIYRIMGVHDTALLYLEQSLDISRQLGHRHIEADILSTMSQLYYGRGDHPTALPLVQEALSLQEALGDLPSRRELLMQMSTIMLMREEPGEAIRLLADCVKICRQQDDKRGECTNLNAIADIYRDKHENNTALRYLMASLKVSRQIGDKYIENDILKNIVEIMENHLPREQALTLLHDNLQISREIGDRQTESNALTKIAEQEIALQRLDDAQRYLQEAFRICTELRFDIIKSTVLYHFGVIMRERKDRNNAIRYLNESLRLGRETNYRPGIARTLHLLALTVYSIGDLERAAHYLNESIQISHDLHERRLEALKYIDLANFYLDTRVHEPLVAKRYLNEAIKINVILRDVELTRILNDRKTFMDHYRSLK